MRKEKQLHSYEYYKNVLSLIYLLLAASVLVLVSCTIFLVSTNAEIAEKMTRHWSLAWTSGMGKLISLARFSIFEWVCFVLVCVGIGLIVWAIVLACQKQSFKAGKVLCSILVAIVSVVTIYVSTTSICYNRAALPFELVESKQIDKQMVAKSVENFFAEFELTASKVQKDDKGRSVSPYTFQELSQKIKEEYSKLDKEYFGDFTSTAKPIVFDKIMSHCNILGITFVPFGEANINDLAPMTDIVPTMIHELAHTKCVMRESDANFISVYILLSSDDDYLRYCGYYYSYTYLQQALVYSGNYDLLKSLRLPNVAVADRQAEKEFWQQYNFFTNISNFFNDIYLKMNGQSGVGSYFENNKGDQVGVDKDNRPIFANVEYTLIQRFIIGKYAQK